jgi:SAM-dependent methyltransferase
MLDVYRREQSNGAHASGNKDLELMAVECPICGFEGDAFAAGGVITRPNAQCPRCLSLERHRLVWLYLTNETDLFAGTRTRRMLHLAPELCIRQRLSLEPTLDYLPADLDPRGVEVQMDVTAIGYPDDFFDVIYCSHVLEHVPDDRRAMRELARVLAPEGWAILQVPIWRDETDEDPTLTDEAERIRRFRQRDHVRIYGLDYPDRLAESGFEVTVDPYPRRMSWSDVHRFGLHRHETVNVGRKALGDAGTVKRISPVHQITSWAPVGRGFDPIARLLGKLDGRDVAALHALIWEGAEAGANGEQTTRLGGLMRALGTLSGAEALDETIGRWLFAWRDPAQREDLRRLLVRHGIAPVTLERIDKLVEKLKETPDEAWPAPIRSPASTADAIDHHGPPAPFVVGVARSGTTLLRLMLDSHSELAIPGETHFVPSVINGGTAAADPSSAALQLIVNDERWPGFELDPEALRERAQALGCRSAGDVLRAFYSMYAESHGKQRWGDKTPWYVVKIEAIAAALTEAHFVHIIRDGRDVALSVIPLWFGPRTPAEAAQWWADRVIAGRRAASKGVPYCEVFYERLVAQPEAELERICEFLGLEYEPQMLEFGSRASVAIETLLPTPQVVTGPISRAETTARDTARLSGPVDALSVGRWRNEMTADQLQEFEDTAGELLSELGYELGSS